MGFLSPKLRRIRSGFGGNVRAGEETRDPVGLVGGLGAGEDGEDTGVFLAVCWVVSEDMEKQWECNAGLATTNSLSGHLRLNATRVQKKVGPGLEYNIHLQPADYKGDGP